MSEQKCNDDCAHCKLPVEQCHGGSYRKAYERPKKNTKPEIGGLHSQHGNGRRVSHKTTGGGT